MFLLICWPDSLAEHFCMHSCMIIPLNALKNRSHKWEIKWIFVSTLFIRMCFLSVISSALQVSYVSSHKCTDNFDVYPISLSFSLYCIFSHMNIYLLFCHCLFVEQLQFLRTEEVMKSLFVGVYFPLAIICVARLILN